MQIPTHKVHLIKSHALHVRRQEGQTQRRSGARVHQLQRENLETPDGVVKGDPDKALKGVEATRVSYKRFSRT